MPHALLVEDDEKVLQPLTEMARRQGFSSSCARTLHEARSLLEQERTDLLVLDTSLPDGSGLTLLEEAGHHNLHDVIVMSESLDAESMVSALRNKQVRDCLLKPIDFSRVQTHLQSVARACQGEPDNGLRPPAVPRPAFDLMLGNSQAMRRIYQLIARVAPTDATVLIVGESGTGKELIAQTIHARSRRHRGPLVPINCGAIPENLIESELFGHEKGAFTGASQMRRGVFERAHGGTLFLDEISEMPADLQVRLLRALETNKITRVGGEKEIPIDTRIIAATNRPPEQAVAQGKLREDLLYRLAVFPIHVPPLRHRDDDVELLAHHFLAVFNKSQGRTKRFHPLALQRLRAHPWPGNVRQLRNAIHRAYILADAEIGPDDLPPPPTAANKPIHGELRFPLGSPLADIERQMILATLEHFKGDKRRTAKTLGVSLKTLYNRLNAYRVNNGSSAAQRVGASRAGLM